MTEEKLVETAVGANAADAAGVARLATTMPAPAAGAARADAAGAAGAGTTGAEPTRDWQTLATAWELAAFSFRYPTQELIDVLASGEWVAAAREIAQALGRQLPGNFGEGLAANSAGSLGGTPETALAKAPEKAPATTPDLHALRAEATRLFVGAPNPEVSPYEGIWRAADDGVKGLLFVNPHSMDVERFCKACGLGRPEGTNEPLDHVATEAELLELLALRAAGAQPENATVADNNLPGGSPAAAYEQFLEEHLNTWVPRFAEKVADETTQPFYKAAAQYLVSLLQLQP